MPPRRDSDDRALPQAARGYHPIYKGVPLSLITLVDECCAHGNFRTWAKFTHHAQRIIESSGRLALDEEVARNVFARFGGSRHAA
jgi:hypothetical protein